MELVRRIDRIAGVPALLSILVIVSALLASLGPPSTDRVVVVALINLIFVVALYLFVGNSGVMSFGHLSFAAIGAYSGGLFAMSEDLKRDMIPDAPEAIITVTLGSQPAVLLAGVVAALVALAVVIPLSRISGLAAGIATVSLLISVRVVAGNWDALTRGRKSLSGVPIATDRNVVLAWAVLLIFVAWTYQRSGWGKQLRASKSDEIAAVAAGISVPVQRGIAFVVSAFFTGVGGALFALFLGSVGPDIFYLDLTFLIIAMLVVGGVNTLSGAVIGTLGMSAVAEILRRVESGDVVGLVDIPARPGIQRVVLGTLLVLVLLRRPQGVVADREISLTSLIDRLRPSTSSPEQGDNRT